MPLVIKEKVKVGSPYNILLRPLGRVDLGTEDGGGVSAPRPDRFTAEKDPVSIEQEAGGRPRAGLDGWGKSCLDGDSIPGPSSP